MEHIIEYAEAGDLDNVDLKIKHMTDKESLSILSRELTASNFGNVSEIANAPRTTKIPISVLINLTKLLATSAG